MKKKTKVGITMFVVFMFMVLLSVPVFVQGSDGPPGGSVWTPRHNSFPWAFVTATTWDSAQFHPPSRLSFPEGNPAQVTNGRVRGRITGEQHNVFLNNQNRWVTTWAIINSMNHVSGPAW